MTDFQEKQVVACTTLVIEDVSNSPACVSSVTGFHHYPVEVRKAIVARIVDAGLVAADDGRRLSVYLNETPKRGGGAR